ncbi:MAG: ATP-binding protein [Anaerolineae bacterium]
MWVTGDPRYPNGAQAPCGCRQREARRRELARLTAAAGLTSDLLARYTFARFDPTRARGAPDARADLAATKRACEAYANAPLGWLILSGRMGCGKTHLAYAIAGARLQAGEAVFVAAVPDLLDTLREGYDAREGFQTRMRLLRTCPLLLIDDLGVENPTPWGAEKLYQIVDYRYQHRLPLVVATNINPYSDEAGDRGRIEPRILSRLLEGAHVPNGFSQVHLLRVGDYRRTAQAELLPP